MTTKKMLLIAVALGVLAFILISLSSCEKVQPNYIGVLMENYGKNGKADFSIQRGKVNTMAPGTELYQVPGWEQKTDFENNALKLKAMDNTEFTSKPVYSYIIMEDRAVDVVFDNRHLGSGDSFMKSVENNTLEPKIYDIMKEESRKYLTDTLMANGGSLRYENVVEVLVKEEFRKRGFRLVNFSSQLEFSQKVKEKIDTRNEVNTNISVLDQQIMEQRKRNELAALKAEENIILSRGITPQILSQQWISKWNGVSYGDNKPLFLKNVE